MSNKNSGYIKKKKDMNFKNMESLHTVANVVNEAAEAVNDKKRTIKGSSIPDVLAGAVGAGIGWAGSFAALYGLGTAGLAVAGSIVGGGMVAGIFVLAAPVAILGGVGIKVTANLKAKQLKQEKERLYKEALRKHDAIIKNLKEEVDANEERTEYLQSLNVLLRQAIADLQKDLGISSSIRDF